MVSSINNINQISFQPQRSVPQVPPPETSGSLASFDEEDNAIISAQAKMQYELEKFNSGSGDPLDLALSEVIAKTTVAAEVNVIQTKKDMFDEILKIGT